MGNAVALVITLLCWIATLLAMAARAVQKGPR